MGPAPTLALRAAPQSLPRAREYKRTAIALAVATAFKLTFFMWYFTRISAVLYAWLFGTLVVDLAFRAIGSRSHVKSRGASLGAAAVYTNFFAIASVIFWFEESDLLLTMLATSVSLLLGSAGTFLLFAKALRAERCEA